MNPPVGGEVQGSFSAVDDIAGRFAGFEAQDAGGENLADFAQALGSRHGIRIQSVEQNETMRVAMPVLLLSTRALAKSSQRDGLVIQGREGRRRAGHPEHDDA